MSDFYLDDDEALPYQAICTQRASCAAMTQDSQDRRCACRALERRRSSVDLTPSDRKFLKDLRIADA